MKSNLKMMLLAATFFATNNFCHAQKSITLQALGKSAAQKQWEVNLPTSLKELTFNYAILNDGVVTFSRNQRTLLCYGFDSKLKWEKITSEYPAAQVFSSSNGACLMVSYNIVEDAGASFIYSNHGEVLRPINDRTGYYFAAGSKYIIDCRYSPKVLNGKTSELLSKPDDQKYWNWKGFSTPNGQLVVCASGSLELFDLPTGKRLWQREVSLFGSSTYLEVAKNGSIITIQNLIFGGINKNYIFVYNLHGDLLHRIEKPLVVGKTNGGIIEAISDDGQYLAFGDNDEFYVCSSKTLARVWTVREKIRPLDVQKFTKNLLAFKTSYDSKKTRVFVLNDDGQIEKDYRFDQILDFSTPANLLESGEAQSFLKSLSKDDQAISIIPVLQIDERWFGWAGVKMSLYYLRPQAIKD